MSEQSCTSTDCRSETGITVSLIDAIIAIARILAHRDLRSIEIGEALQDLRSDEDVSYIVSGVVRTQGSTTGVTK